MNEATSANAYNTSNPPTPVNDPGYSVYLIYQKEVYNSDHAFLQSMMDWLYTSHDSPYKFIFRNRAFININHYGIILTKDKSIINNQQLTSESINCADNNKESHESSNWTNIHFNLKHLKEIYVDKRHKDTCVLVSKVSSSSKVYVWKKTNPSNYHTFRSPYALNNAYKKSYLLMIIKFKDGPSKLLKSIQLLDSILADYNQHHFNQNNHNFLNFAVKKHNSTSDPNSLNMNTNINNIPTKENDKLSSSHLENIYNSGNRCINKQMGCNANSAKFFNSIGHGATKNNRIKPNIQQYFNDYFTKKVKCEQHQQNTNNKLLLNGNGSASCIVQPKTYSSTSSTNIVNNDNTNSTIGHSSLKNSLNSISNIMIRQPRRLSIDNSNIFLNNLANNNNKLNNPLYSSSINNSNISLQSYCSNCNNKNSNNTSNAPGNNNITHSFSLSRHSSVNEITPGVIFHYQHNQHQNQYRHQNQHQNNIHYHYHNQMGYNHNANNKSQPLIKTNSINSASSFSNYPTTNHLASNSVPASPAPRNISTNPNHSNVQNDKQQGNRHHHSCRYYNSNNTSIENLSEINYQQYNKKLLVKRTITPNNCNGNFPRCSVSSTSSLNQTDLNNNVLKTYILHNSTLPPKFKPISKVNSNSNTLITVTNNQQQVLPSSQEDIKRNKSVKRNSSMSSSQKYTSSKQTSSTNIINQATNENCKNILIEVKKNLNKIYNGNIEKREYPEDSQETTSNNVKEDENLENNNKFIQQETANKDVDNSDIIYTLQKSSKCEQHKNNENTGDCLNRKIQHLSINDINERTNASLPEQSPKTNESNKKVRDIINTFNNFNRNSAFVSTQSTNQSTNNNHEEYISNENTSNTSKKASNLNLPKVAKTSVEQANTTQSNNENTHQILSNSSVKNYIINWNYGVVGNEDKSNEYNLPVKTQSKINKITEKLNQELNKSISSIEKNVMLKSRNGANNNNSECYEEEQSAKNNLIKGSQCNTPKNEINKNLSLEKEKFNKAINEVKDVQNGTQSTKVDTLIKTLKSSSSSFEASSINNAKIQDKISSKTVQFSNQTNGSSSNKPSNDEQQQQQQKANSTPPRKRTFANMNWPMDPEEEKILRSSSPYVVPEVIVQRNERVKSILKKNNFNSLNDINHAFNDESNQTVTENNIYKNKVKTASPTLDRSTKSINLINKFASSQLTNNLANKNISSMASPLNKKRVDFRENFCLVNFFESNPGKNQKKSNEEVAKNKNGGEIKVNQNEKDLN